MAEFPAFPLWTDAYLADCQHLTDAEHGRYLRLLMLLWRSPNQRVPNDVEWLARKMGRTPQLCEEEVMPLVREFCQCSGNWITQKRLTKEFAYLQKNSKSQRDRAKSRWKKEKEVCPDDAEPHKSGNPPTPTPTPTPLTATSVAVEPLAFKKWEEEIFKTPNIQNSNLAISAMVPVVMLAQDGYDLHTEVLPVVKADVSKAMAANRLNKLSWAIIAKQIRDNRSNAKPANFAPVDWSQRISAARKLRKWDDRWGPLPNQPGCQMPPDLAAPTDGQGWTEWRPA